MILIGENMGKKSWWALTEVYRSCLNVLCIAGVVGRFLC